MKVKRTWLLVVSIIFTLPILCLVTDRIILLLNSEHTTGTVKSILATNDRCSSGRYSPKYDCTKFSAGVTFTTQEGQLGSYSVSAGSARGYNQPTTGALLAVGDSVPTIYDRRDPVNVYEDTFFSLWGTPLMLFAIQILLFSGSLLEGRKPKEAEKPNQTVT